MKYLASLIIASALASSAVAGTTYTSSKGVAPVTVPTGCDCFAPGLAVGINGSGIFFDGGDDDAAGGGVLAEYFFTEMIGVQGSYNLLATDSEHHELDAALVVRFPITDLCIAPYIMGGAGYSMNSDNAWNLFAGGGIDIRLPDMGCMGIFADGAYHWSENDGADFTLVRLGLKFPL